jgi:hypothetical protein
MKKILLFLVGTLYCVGTMAQWTDDPSLNNRITADGASLYDAVPVVSKNGITYLVFNKLVDGNIATYVQIIDKEGNKLFPDEGKLISAKKTWTFTLVNQLAFADNDGNVLLLVLDTRSDSPDNSLNLVIYKVSPTGELLWGEDGIDINHGIAYGMEAQIKVIQLEDGSYVFAWSRTASPERSIQLQRLSGNGEFLWDKNLELKETNVVYNYPYLTNAGNNTFVLVYTRGTAIMAKKLDFDGESIWPKDVRIYDGANLPSIPLQNVFSVLPDPNGGVFVGWYDFRQGPNVESAIVAYVKPNGELGFTGTEGGERVGYSNYRGFSPRMAYDKAKNCVYVISRETSGSQSYQRFVLQKLAMSGELLWDLEGIQIDELSGNVQLGYHTIQSVGNGQFAVFYLQNRGFSDISPIAALIDGETGDFVWPEEKINLSTVVTRKANLIPSQLIDGKYWITSWADDRTEDHIENLAIYMQKLNLDGSFGNKETAIQLPVKNTGFSVQSSFIEETAQFVVENTKAGNADITIYSLSGQKVASVFHGQMAQGTENIQWNTKTASVKSGIYFATLRNAEGQKTLRIIIK